MIPIYEDVIEMAENYETLNNDTARLSWLQITPHVRQSVQHIVKVTDTGSENNTGSDVYSEVDLESHQSAVYTRPAKCDDTAKVTEDTIQYSVSNNYIKVKYIVTEEQLSSISFDFIVSYITISTFDIVTV